MSRLFLALYQSIAAHARQDLNVVVISATTTPVCARLLADLGVLFVGVYCPLKTIMARRNAQPDSMYVKGDGILTLV